MCVVMRLSTAVFYYNIKYEVRTMKNMFKKVITGVMMASILCSSVVCAGAAEVSTGGDNGSEAVGAIDNNETVGSAVDSESVGVFISGLEVAYVPSTGMIEAKPKAFASWLFGSVDDVDSWTLSITPLWGRSTSKTGKLDSNGKMSVSAQENTTYAVQMTARVRIGGYTDTGKTPTEYITTGYRAPKITKVVNLKTDQRVCFKTNGSKSNNYIIYRREKDKTHTGSWSSKKVNLSDLYYDSRTGEYGVPMYNGEIKSGKLYQYQVQSVEDKKGNNRSYSNVSGMTWISSPKVKNVTRSGNKLTVSWTRVDCVTLSTDYSGALRYELWCKVDNGSYSKVADVSQSVLSFTGNLKKGAHRYSYQVRAYRANIGCGKPYSAFSSVYNVTAV